MSVTLLVLTYLAGIFLVSINASSCPVLSSPLYPYGPDRGDTVTTNTDDQYFKINIGYTFDFYGKKFSSFFFNANGLFSFIFPVTLAEATANTQQYPSFTPFWADVLLKNGEDQAIYFRKVNITLETDVVSMIETDSQRIGLSLNPEWIAMFTWKNVPMYDGFPDVTNTFQAVVASDGNKTITVFNYGSINWIGQSSHLAAVMFNKGDSKTRVDYSISMTNEMLNIADYSNVGIPGRIVTRVDGDIQLRELEKYACSSCIIDRVTGNITTFDGSQELRAHRVNRKFLLSKEYEGNNDPCRYMLKVTTGETGSIDWVSFTVNSRLKRNFAFERQQNNTAEVRGRKIKMIITSFPYTEVMDDNGQELTVVVDNITGGWMVHSPNCQYYMVYKPNDESQQLQLFLGSYYQNNTFGMCQNNNGDVTDERKTCARPPEDVVGDDFLTAITDSCSCPKTNKQCTKALSRL